MLKLVFVGCLLGVASAQFRGFGFGSRRDSLEDISDENFFGSNRNFASRRNFDDSPENNFGFRRNFDSRDDDDSDERRSFGRNRNFVNRNFDDSFSFENRFSSRRQTPFRRLDRDRSIERSFGSNFVGRNFDNSFENHFGARRQTNFLNRNFDDSFESNRRRNPFGRRDFDDDSDERVFGRTNFRNNNNVGRTHQIAGHHFGTTQTVGRPNFFTRQNFGTTNQRTNNNFLIDSPEDLLDDLFDDDLDDRLRAQNALSHFQSPGTRLPPNRGTNNAFRFGTSRRQPNTNFGVARPQINNGGSFSFRTPLGRNRQTSQISTPQRTTFNQVNPFTTNRVRTNQPPKQPRRFTINTIRNQDTSRKTETNRFTNRQKQTPRTPRVFGNTGFNWPGGNGYFVSMRTGTGKPTSYFVKFDD